MRPIVAQHHQRRSQFKQLESTLPKDVCTQLLFPICFLEEDLQKQFSILSYVKIQPKFVAHPTPYYHNLSKFESTLPMGASTQFWPISFLDEYF